MSDLIETYSNPLHSQNKEVRAARIIWKTCQLSTSQFGFSNSEGEEYHSTDRIETAKISVVKRIRTVLQLQLRLERKLVSQRGHQEGGDFAACEKETKDFWGMPQMVDSKGIILRYLSCFEASLVRTAKNTKAVRTNGDDGQQRSSVHSSTIWAAIK